ncbi:MAG: hypothetical protein SGJ19_07395 [Planctomycetia bacterium]|nr:hypothetical protein [Planctomycetia bacterium]
MGGVSGANGMGGGSTTQVNPGSSPYYFVGRICNANAKHRGWSSGAMVGPRHVLTSAAGLVNTAGIDPNGELTFWLEHCGFEATIVDVATVTGSDVVIALLKDEIPDALRVRAFPEFAAPYLPSTDAFRVAAVGYDMPVIGSSVTWHGELTVRNGMLDDSNTGVQGGKLQGAIAGMKLASDFNGDDDDDVGFGSLGTLLAGGVIGLTFGADMGAVSDRGFYSAQDFEWNQGAVGGPILLDGGREIVGVMSVLRTAGPEIELGGTKVVAFASHDAELLSPEGTVVFQSFIKQ